MNRHKIIFLILIFFNIKSAQAELLDPTQPTAPNEIISSSGSLENASSENHDNLQLNAVMYSHQKNINSVVVINGIVLGINSMINGFTVKAISPQSVVLFSHDGNQLVLHFDTLNVKNFHSVKIGNNA